MHRGESGGGTSRHHGNQIPRTLDLLPKAALFLSIRSTRTPFISFQRTDPIFKLPLSSLRLTNSNWLWLLFLAHAQRSAHTAYITTNAQECFVHTFICSDCLFQCKQTGAWVAVSCFLCLCEGKIFTNSIWAGHYIMILLRQHILSNFLKTHMQSTVTTDTFSKPLLFECTIRSCLCSAFVFFLLIRNLTFVSSDRGDSHTDVGTRNCCVSGCTQWR